MFCTRAPLLALLLLLAACAQVADKPAAPDATQASVAAEGAAPAAREPVPNPYAQQAEPEDPSARALLDKANTALGQQQWGKAEPLLLQAIAQAPNYSGLYYNLGLVYYRLNRPEAAAAQWQNAVAVNDKNIYAYNALAMLKRQAGDFAGAESLYRQALAVWPDHPDSHKNLAILYDLYMGRLPDALASYQAYQALQPEPDRLVDAWIIDLKRRLPEASAATADATNAEIAP